MGFCELTSAGWMCMHPLATRDVHTENPVYSLLIVGLVYNPRQGWCGTDSGSMVHPTCRSVPDAKINGQRSTVKVYMKGYVVCGVISTPPPLSIAHSLLLFTHDERVHMSAEPFQGNTPLHMACKMGDLGTVELLLEVSR